MELRKVTMGLAAAGVVLAGCGAMQPTPGPQNMSFFVTSTGPGNGANLGGLAGADAHCQSLAAAAGAGARTWRAYLSTQTPTLPDPNAVNARDRIGAGPWRNYNGVVVATSVADLHSATNNVNKATTVDERGRLVNGRTETPMNHDMLTGSRPDGTSFPGAPFPDMTCGNWTKGGPDGSAMLGHHDGAGPNATAWATSWNSSHPSLGCDAAKLRPTGGAGLFYCFATN